MDATYTLLTHLLIPLILFTHFFSPSSSISVFKNEVDTEFPDAVTFFIGANSTSPIEKVTLIYGTSGDSCFSSTVRRELKFDPTRSVNLEWTWDQNRSGGLPPGAAIWWQWEIVNQDGELETTDRQEITFQDRRFQWQTLKQSPVTVYWMEGGAAFGRLLIEEAAESLERLTHDFGIDAPDQVLMMVYPSTEDLLSATLHVPDWTGGVAYADYSTVMMAIAPEDVSWAEQVIPHELAHLVVDRRISNCQGNGLPTWLSEGLAMYAEGPVDGGDEQAIRDALTKGRLPALNSLTAGFAANPDMAEQAYTYSSLVVRYLIETYGSDDLDQFLGLIQAGRKTESALKDVYGFDTNGLDQAVRASMGFDTPIVDTTATPVPNAESTPIPTLALWSPFTAEPTVTPTIEVTPIVEIQTEPAPPGTVVPIENEPGKETPSTGKKIPGFLLWLFGIGGAGMIALISIATVIIIRTSKRKNRLL